MIDFDTSSLSSTNKSAAQILKYRAQIASGQQSSVISALKNAKDPSSRALVALAKQRNGDKSAVDTASTLAEEEPEDATVQIVAGTILAAGGETAQAAELLSKHQGSLEAVALLVQIHLQVNRTDLALKEVAAAKRWANDSLLINLAEAWTNLRVGGSEKYQSAFYVFEELATTPGTTSTTALVGQAVSEMHLGRWEEANAALEQAMAIEGASPESIVNAIVLASVLGKQDLSKDLTAQLRSKEKGHVLLMDLQEKSDLFDTAAAKYSAKVS